jgi:hypothetical protein
VADQALRGEAGAVRDYSKVSPRFWTGDTGKDIRKLGRDCQVIAFYLFTCPSANMLGLYYLAMPTLCHETASPSRGALKALRSLQEAKFAYYDLPSEIVYVPNMAREQIGERLKRKDNRHIAVLRELESLRKTPFFSDFIIRYRDAFELHDVQIEPGYTSPLGGPLEPLRSQEQDQKQEQEQEQKQKKERGKRAFDPGLILGLNLDAWGKWVAYRAEGKWPIKPMSLQDAAEELAAFGADQMTVVKKSVASGWRGLFAPKNGSGAPGATPKPRKTADELEAEEVARNAQH